MTHRVIWGEAAIADLRGIFHWTVDHADPEVALRFTQRIEAEAEKLAGFPNRGRPRDEIRPGLRSIPYARSITIFYSVDAREVQIVRVIHARRDLNAAFESD